MRGQKIVLWLARLGIVLGLAVFALDFALMLPALRVVRTIPAGAIAHEVGPSWRVDLWPLESEKYGNLPGVGFWEDVFPNPSGAAFGLSEDGVSLKPFSSIRKYDADPGDGHYFRWGGSVLFSASDNSDPAGNGRAYVFSGRLSVSPTLKMLAGVLILLSFMLLAAKGSPGTIRKAFVVSLGYWRSENQGNAFSFSRMEGAGVLAGIVLSWLLLFAPVDFLPEVSGGYTQGLLQVSLVALLSLMAISVLCPKKLRPFLPGLLCLAVILFHLPLFDNWHGFNNDWGLFLPASDADRYYHGSLNLLETGYLDTWNQRRPIAAALAAVRLWLAGGDLRAALALQATLVALAVLFAARQVARRFGLAASALLFLGCLYFVASHLPTLFSESTGLFWGAIGLGFLWRGVEDKSPALSGVGSFFLSFGLLARAGPFFILPALLLWAFLFHKGRQRFRWCGSVVAGIAGAFALNWLYLHILGTGENVANSNFAQVLYGMSVGGKGWMQVQADHPELLGETPENVQAIYDIAMGNILNAPGEFFGYLWRQLMDAPGFVMRLPVLYVFPLSATGLVILVFTGLHRKSVLLLLVFAGIVASAPLLMQDGGVRVFASVIPLVTLLSCLAVWFVQSMFAEILGVQDQASPTSSRRGLLVLAGVLAIYVLLPFAFIGGAEKAFRVEPGQCPDGQTAIPLVSEYATVLRVHEKGELTHPSAMDVSVETYEHVVEDMELSAVLGKPQAPFSMVSFYMDKEMSAMDRYAVLEGQLWHPAKNGRYMLCVAEADIGPMPVQSIHEVSR